MKVTPEHLTDMREGIVPLDTEERRKLYREGRIPRADLIKDLNKRYRWDLYYAAARRGMVMPDSTDGYNINHIDTALRSIVKPL